MAQAAARIECGVYTHTKQHTLPTAGSAHDACLFARAKYAAGDEATMDGRSRAAEPTNHARGRSRRRTGRPPQRRQPAKRWRLMRTLMPGWMFCALSSSTIVLPVEQDW
jgi:hypothetical protein